MCEAVKNAKFFTAFFLYQIQQISYMKIGNFNKNDNFFMIFIDFYNGDVL